MCGRSTSRRSARSRSGSAAALEDRPRTVGRRAWMPAWVHGQTATGTEWAAGGQYLLGLLRERLYLLGAQPETNGRGRRIRRGTLGGGGFAGNDHKHAARLVIPETHLGHLPLRLARL